MRNKDFHLEYNAETGEYVATENTAGNAVFNRIFTVLNIQKGTLISNEEYGSLIHLVKTSTDRSEALLKTHIKNALNTLLNDIERIELTSCRIDKLKGIADLKIFCRYRGTDYTFSHWIKI